MARRRKPASANGGFDEPTDNTGHNSKTDLTPDAVKEYFGRLDELHDEMESFCGGKRADIKEVYEEAANGLGVPRKILRKRYSVERAKAKLEKWKEELEAPEHERWIALNVALGDDFINTGLGQAAAEREGAQG